MKSSVLPKFPALEELPQNHPAKALVYFYASKYLCIYIQNILSPAFSHLKRHH